MGIQFSTDDLRNPAGLERVLRQFESALNVIGTTNQSKLTSQIQTLKSDIQRLSRASTIVPSSGIQIVQTPDQTTIINSGATSLLAGTGIAVSASTGDVTITNTGVLSNIAGTGISVSGATGNVTITNTGVTSAIGTANQVTVSAATGAVTFSLPQSIATTSTPQFARTGFGAAADATYPVYATANNGIVKLSAATGTSRVWLQMDSTGGVLQLGLESSTGGSLYTGGLAYASALGTQNATALQFGTNGTIRVTIDSSGNVGLTQKINQYNSITTTGWGVAAVYASGRATGQTGANASVSTYTVGASDGTFIISANILVTAFTAGTITAQVTYKDEGGTSRTAVFNFASITGTLGTAVGAAGAFEGIPLHIRVQANAVITIATTVSIFTGTYNVEGYVTQIG